MKNLLTISVLMFLFQTGSFLRAEDAETKLLFDKEKPRGKMVIPNDGSEEDVKIDVTKEGIDVKIKATGNASFPGIQLKPNQNWNLSKYSRIEAVVANTSAKVLRVNIRVDNEVKGKSDTWNTEVVAIEPGQSKTITVNFGTSYGSPGYALDGGEIAKILIFTGLSDSEQSFRVESVQAAGKTDKK